MFGGLNSFKNNDEAAQRRQNLDQMKKNDGSFGGLFGGIMGGGAAAEKK